VAFGNPALIDVAGNAGALDATIEQTPDRPAVFLVWPRQGAPYLARTRVLRRRLKRLLGERPGPSRWLNLRPIAARAEYWRVGSQLESNLLFYELARRHFPDTYLALVKLRMPSYVKLFLANRFPRTLVTTRLSGRGLYCGPFRSRTAAEQFEAQALELFQIRRCQEDFEPSPQHPGCIYGEMNKCLRPCQQAVSVEEYRAEAERVAAFLKTGGQSLIEPLEAAREKLSQELRFEDAAREHKRIEKVLEVVRLRDDLASDIDALHGVAVTASAEAGAVVLWFVSAGCWQPPVRFGFEVVEGKTVSMDHRLREIAASLQPRRAGVQERQEHLALLARWYYSSWRDGEWLQFSGPQHVPYRKLVNAISRVAALSAPPS
jgi:excinuclease ABC subunit C